MATHEVTSDNLADTVAKNEVVLLDFWATWCPPCRAFGPVFEESSEKHPDVFFGKVDVDQQQELAAQAQISAVPTLIVFKQGQIVYSGAGALGSEQLEDLIGQAIALKMQDDESADAAHTTGNAEDAE